MLTNITPIEFEAIVDDLSVLSERLGLTIESIETDMVAALDADGGRSSFNGLTVTQQCSIYRRNMSEILHKLYDIEDKLRAVCGLPN